MERLQANLPPLHILGQFLTKREWGVVAKINFLPSVFELKRTRSGNKISRFFRIIFEHKKIKTILGSNLALAFMVSSFIPNQPSQAINLESGQEKVIFTEAISLKTTKGTQYPTKTKKINQGYSFFHPGLDFDGEIGDFVYPIMPGRVEAIQVLSKGINTKGILSLAYGNAVLVKHGGSLQTLYAHLSEIDVKEGQPVSLDTIVGKVGSTGRSSGSHLHLEVRQSGYQINPFTVLPR